MAAAAEAAFLSLIARRDGKSVGGPEVGHAMPQKRRPQSSELPQGPPGAALRRMSSFATAKKNGGGAAHPTGGCRVPAGEVAAANASACTIQVAWRAHVRHQREANSWAARQKRAAQERARQQKRTAWLKQEAEAEALRKAYLAEEARLAEETRRRAERAAEEERLEAEREAAEAAAEEAAAQRERERAEQQRWAAELAAQQATEAAAASAASARLAAAEREIARLAAQRSAAVSRVRAATERRALAVVGRATVGYRQRRRARADAASGAIGRGLLCAKARRQLAARRAEALAAAALRLGAQRRIRRALQAWARARQTDKARRGAAATAIAASQRRRACEADWRRSRMAAVRLARAWRRHARQRRAADTIGAAARARLARTRKLAACARLVRAWRARKARVVACEEVRRRRDLRALSVEQRRRSAAASTRIAGSVRRLLAKRRRARLEAQAAAEASARRLAFERDNRAAARIGGVWAARQQRRRLVRQRQSAVQIQAHVRGYLERERCELLVGGKTAFDFPRRLEECVLDFPSRSTKLSAKAKAELAFVITALKRQKTLKLRVVGCTLHTEPTPTGLARAQTVVGYLTTKGILKQQLRAEARPPDSGAHGTAACGFVVVQSMFLPKRLSFEPGSAELPPSAPPMLEKVVRTLEAIEGLDLVLEGHCDVSEANPADLSGRRAACVKRWLAANGCNVKVGTVAVGHACPVATNLTYQGRRHNRRVEIQIRPRH